MRKVSGLVLGQTRTLKEEQQKGKRAVPSGTAEERLETIKEKLNGFVDSN